MKIGLQQRSLLEASGPAGVHALHEFQSLVGAISAWTNTEHDDDGHHVDITASSITLTKLRDAALRIVSGWLDAGGGVAYSGAITPPAITGDQNNYSPLGIDEAFLLRLSSSTAVAIGGLKDGDRLIPLGGRLMAVFNAGANNIVLVHENLGSTDNYRFRLPGFLDMVIPPNNFALLYYDAKSRRWAMLSSSSGTGGSTSSEYNAGDSGANITLDWANGTQQIVTLTNNANITLANGVEGQLYRLILVEDASGGFTPDFVDPTVVFENDVLKPASIAAGAVLQVSLYYTLLNGGQYFAAYTTPELALGIDAGDITLTDDTTNNVTSSAHGFAPKSPADATKFLNGAATPAYAQVKDSDLSTSDITTNNVSTTKHGFTPKLPNDATKYLDGTGAFTVPSTAAPTRAITFVFDGGASALTTGAKKIYIRVPYACTISDVTLIADQTGSVVLEIKKCTYSGFPGSLTSIVASAPPTLSTAQKSQDTTLTGWTLSVTAGDILEVSITSATTVTSVFGSLKVA